MKILPVILVALFLAQKVNGQLADGSQAPDFTLTDYDGNTHNLYSYLEADKTVILKIFAAHCPSCWNYHQTHRLKNLYNTYGPDGSDEIMVLALEHDQYNNHNAFIGIGDPWVTQGNWLEDTPFPIFDVEWPDRGVFDDYNVNFYPIIYKICPDKIIERVMTSETETEIYEKVAACYNALDITEKSETSSVRVDPFSKGLILDSFSTINQIVIYNLNGKVLKTYGKPSSNRIGLEDFNQGIYLFETHSENGTNVNRFFLN